MKAAVTSIVAILTLSASAGAYERANLFTLPPVHDRRVAATPLARIPPPARSRAAESPFAGVAKFLSHHRFASVQPLVLGFRGGGVRVVLTPCEARCEPTPAKPLEPPTLDFKVLTKDEERAPGAPGYAAAIGEAKAARSKVPEQESRPALPTLVPVIAR